MRTVIKHEILTKTGKVAKSQPVDKFRKLLEKQKIEFTERISEGEFWLDGKFPGYKSYYVKHNGGPAIRGVYSVFRY